ncbi:MAG: hypothetical protein F9K18_06005 [Thermoanaerobaculia bacterium]|nr:MAG: hypothetical protein F9K18_06005 [Thermoanaerobaculia bacterium]
MSRGCRILAMTALALAALLAGPALAQKSEMKNTTADIARPDEAVARVVAATPGSPALAAPPRDFPHIVPETPQAILYDQTDNPGTNGFPSQNFEPANNAFDNQGADDFVVPAGTTWLVDTVDVLGSYSAGGGPVPNVDVFFYADAAGLPGAEVFSALGVVPTDAAGDLSVTLPVAAALPAGHYWVSVIANMNFTPNGQWFWSTRTIQANSPYAWRNPGGGFGTPCASWGAGAATCGVGGGIEPDALFRLQGNAASTTLVKTVGTVPGVCAGTDAITVPYGTDVYYCFSLQNTGAIAYNFHDLVDDHLGTILNNVNIALAPGASHEEIVADTAIATVTNVGTWTARDINPGYVADDTVPFNFIDISATGTALNLTDDSEANVTMPFSFTFYGVTSANVRVGNNGGMLFNATTGDIPITNAALPVAAPPLSILPFWDDLDQETGNVYHETQGVAPNRQFIVQWHDRPHFPGPGVSGVTFQVILYEGTNEILFQYLDTDFGSATTNFGASATAGLNLDATTATQYSFNTPVLTASKAILFSLGTVNEASASDTATVTVTVPDIVVSPASLSSVLPEGGTETLPLDIQNVGTGDLDWTVGEAAAPLAAGMRRGPEAVLHDNGPLVTHPGGGAGGADASALQTALGMTIFGYGHQISANNRVADDFTVPGPAPWTIDTITFFAYQTGSTTTSTINDVRVQIWDGIPGAAGSNVVFGDLVTNRLASSTWTNAYRVTDTTITDSARPIMANVVTIGTTLPPGTYWLDWFCGGTLASGPWAPPVTILGSTGSGNAMQSTAGGAFAPLIDVGPQDFPFVIEGTSSACDTPSDLPWASVSPAAGTTPPATTDTVDVTFDATGLAVGLYEGLLCVNSNDPDTSLVEVPVSLTVDSMPFLDGFETGNTSRWSLAVP